MKGFRIDKSKNEIIVDFVDKNTAKGYISSAPVWVWKIRFGINVFEAGRQNFIKLKHNLELLNVKLTLEHGE